MRERAAIIGGIIGGIIKLVLDQFTLAIGISSVNTTGEFSRLLFGGTQANLTIWIVYIIGTGLVGWLASKLIPEKSINSYVTSGIVIGVTIWLIMNIVFAASGIITPTWAMGAGSFIVNLITHAILGISITYTMWRYRARVTTQ